MHIIRNAEDYEPTDSDKEVLKEIDEAMENVITANREQSHHIKII